MAETLPINFPLPSESFSANFDYFDWASGFGYRRLYLSTTETSVATSYILTPNTIHSTHGATTIGVSEDRDFDVAFASPQTIEGDVILRFSEAAGSGSASMSATWKIYHVTVGGTETQLATVTTPTVNVGASGRNYLIVTKMAVAKTSFAIGEKLRLNVVTTGTSPGLIAIDPSGLTSTTETDTGRVYTREAFIEVPFIIQN